MNVEELLARARSMIGKPIKYKLAAGGMLPTASTPANLQAGCDCSGFYAWANGYCRLSTHPLYLNYNGGWVNTDAMHYDAHQRLAGLFELLMAPKVGGFVLYRARPGHVGIVSAVQGNSVSKVIHCSAGNYRKLGYAIAETSAEMFARKGRIYGWYCGIEGGYAPA